MLLNIYLYVISTYYNESRPLLFFICSGVISVPLSSVHVAWQFYERTCLYDEESICAMGAGNTRGNIKIGLNVGIVLKQDQGSGKITKGVVKRILTNSSSHPHGIKVQLEDGRVGRVKEIYASDSTSGTR